MSWMFELKLQYPIPLPTSANRAIVPAACAIVLAALSVLQLALKEDDVIPSSGLGGGGVRTNMPLLYGVAVPSILAERPIFSPARSAIVSGEGGVASPLNGAQVAGVISIRGQSYAIVQQPGGRIVRLKVGGRYAGWTLASLNSESAIFRQGATRLPVRFGAVPVQVNDGNEQAEEQQQ